VKTIEFTTKYRTGTGFIKAETTIAVKMILYVQEVPMETTEYTDGIVSTVATVMGERLASTEPYKELAARYNRLVEDET
jgi:hypothetical protein